MSEGLDGRSVSACVPVQDGEHYSGTEGILAVSLGGGAGKLAGSKRNKVTGRTPTRQTGLLEFMVAVSSLPKEERETEGGGRARETELGARHPWDRYRLLWTPKSSNIE